MPVTLWKLFACGTYVCGLVADKERNPQDTYVDDNNFNNSTVLPNFTFDSISTTPFEVGNICKDKNFIPVHLIDFCKNLNNPQYFEKVLPNTDWVQLEAPAAIGTTQPDIVVSPLKAPVETTKTAAQVSSPATPAATGTSQATPATTGKLKRRTK